MLKITIALVIMGFISMTPFPVDFNNDDSRDYELSVHAGPGATTHYTAYHKAIIKGICSSTCDIEVAGVGFIRASPGENVTIKDSKLYKR